MNGRWINAGDLYIGARLYNSSGGITIVEDIEYIEEEADVYNFVVEDWHTYFVGENGILVHNDCPVFKKLKDMYDKIKSYVDDYFTVTEIDSLIKQGKEDEAAKKIIGFVFDKANKATPVGDYPNEVKEFAQDSVDLLYRENREAWIDAMVNGNPNVPNNYWDYVNNK